MSIISVIVPIYNTEKYLNRCVDSILGQTFIDFELILVNDGSSDNCGAICEEYAKKDKRVKVLTQNNQGQATARNLALDWVFLNSDSLYISFVDSDDWIHPQYLEKLYETIESYDINICQCLYEETSKKDIINNYSFLKNTTPLCITPEEQFTEFYSSFMWDKLFHRSCWETIRFPDGKIFEDVAVCYKLLFEETKIGLIKEKLYFYFNNPLSTVHTNWTTSKLSQIEAWEDILVFAKQYGKKTLLQSVLKRYCWVYKHQCDEIKASTSISKREKNKYYSILIGKLRIMLLLHRKELHEMGILFQYGCFAYPAIGWLYWEYKGICGKIKRFFK